ncbi:hypothetical protein Dalk_1462 [Desulfatibacillum aliphaticivorans]|uniref:Uncharacterized protein n=1 Tax=Desulfatibacillum aliphaticivorans TaxID=218208 RepID=B8FA66_DESAL|nr:hypothetical protein [Desulfatibacillum aliphaticivorans]ACL03162.1 hypothetical protein Dalk_1462 [Desulfatibacillum aliphaticivorans]
MCEVLNNASVSAFIGAFSAFILVMLTDIRRRYRDRSLLRLLISDSGDHSQKKLTSVKMNREMVTENNNITDAPFMPFSTQSIRDFQVRALDVLGTQEKQSVDAIIYWMESINDLLNSATSCASKIKTLIKSNASTQERDDVLKDYLEILREGEKNLEYLISMVKLHKQKQYRKVVEFLHPVF